MLTAGGIGQGLSSSAAGKKKKQKISICYQGQTRKVKKKGWQKRYPGATKGPNCGSGCCTADTCFAETVNPVDVQPTSFACCPPELLCAHPTDRTKDQCCYAGETCQPSLATTNPDLGTICCRPCGGNCCAAEQECKSGTCGLADTARLPRTRRG
jgi:hypothetical protein